MLTGYPQYCHSVVRSPDRIHDVIVIGVVLLRKTNKYELEQRVFILFKGYIYYNNKHTSVASTSNNDKNIFRN